MTDLWTVGSTPLPDHAFGIRWPDGTVECRFRIVHPNGSLVADAGASGTVLRDPATECTTCSSACSG